MGNLKDYYTVLNVPENADAEKITASYRKLVKNTHPDRHPDKEAQFREIQEAYDFINDPLKREAYDRNRRPVQPLRTRRGTDIQITLKVRSDDLINEITKNLITTRMVPCTICEGTGSSEKKLIRCSKCSGSGIDVVSSVIGPKKSCSQCKGYGNVPIGTACKNCSGSGLIPVTIPRSIVLSRESQNQIIIPGSGNYPIGKGTPGDLIIFLDIEKDSLFEIHGKTIKGTISISPAQAVLGDIILIHVFGSPVKVIITPGTNQKTEIKINDVVVGNMKKKSTLILGINIEIPLKLSKEEKELYNQLLRCQKGIPA